MLVPELQGSVYALVFEGFGTRAGIFFTEGIFHAPLIIAGEVAEEEKGKHIIAEVVRVHRPAQAVGNVPEGFS